MHSRHVHVKVTDTWQVFDVKMQANSSYKLLARDDTGFTAGRWSVQADIVMLVK